VQKLPAAVDPSLVAAGRVQDGWLCALLVWLLLLLLQEVVLRCSL
jgi:hypothetical protein